MHRCRRAPSSTMLVESAAMSLVLVTFPTRTTAQQTLAPQPTTS